MSLSVRRAGVSPLKSTKDILEGMSTASIATDEPKRKGLLDNIRARKVQNEFMDTFHVIHDFLQRDLEAFEFVWNQDVYLQRHLLRFGQWFFYPARWHCC